RATNSCPPPGRVPALRGRAVEPPAAGSSGLGPGCLAAPGFGPAAWRFAPAARLRRRGEPPAGRAARRWLAAPTDRGLLPARRPVPGVCAAAPGRRALPRRLAGAPDRVTRVAAEQVGRPASPAAWRAFPTDLLPACQPARPARVCWQERRSGA